MYVKSTRPSAKREVQKERSAKSDVQKFGSAKRDDQIARPRRAQTCERSELRAKRAMKMCPRSGQIFFVSIDGMLSENIVAKFYSPYRNSFDGRVPSSDLRGASGRFFSPSENFKARFLKTTFFKIACTIKGEPIKLLL